MNTLPSYTPHHPCSWRNLGTLLCIAKQRGTVEYLTYTSVLLEVLTFIKCSCNIRTYINREGV